VDVELDGNRIESESDFHRAISAALDFAEHYGRNLDALWDALTVDVVVLRDVEKFDVQHGFSSVFRLVLA
jgi:RNAse (barnase) inhibitor barstar